MGAQSIINYTTDTKLKAVIDDCATKLTDKIEITYAMHGPSNTLTEVIRFFLIHHTAIIVKSIGITPSIFTVLHPEYDDVKVSMEPTPRLTITKYLPLSQKETTTVMDATRFKILEGSFADVDIGGLLTFLGYIANEV